MPPFAIGDRSSQAHSFTPRDSGNEKGAESAAKLSAENHLDSSALKILQFAEASFKSSDPQIAKMLNGFSIAGPGGTEEKNLAGELNSFAKNDGAQLAGGILSSIFNGLKDVGAGFASQDQPPPDDQVQQKEQDDQARQLQQQEYARQDQMNQEQMNQEQQAYSS
jgi:hypothetical protein